MAKLTTTKRQKAQRIPIMVIEDNADHWLIIRAALSQCFPEVEPIWINNAAQAIKHLENCIADESKMPRYILLDLYLPRRDDGWGLLDFIKNHLLFKQIPVVVISHSNDNNDIAKSYTYSIASYIIKPSTYHQWLNCFYTFRRYWWEAVTFPARVV